LAPYKTLEEIRIEGEICRIKLSNPLECPLRIWVQNEEKEVSKYFMNSNPIILEKKSDTTLVFQIPEKIEKDKMNYPSRYGNPELEITKEKIYLPFKKSSTYKVVQGYNGNFSHNNEYSRYAIDFNMKTGDTICSVANGYVVGIIDGYSKSGKDKKWKDYANLITIFHPELNLFSQFVHLKKDGSFVKLGEKVIENQPIGICGKTGFMDGEHLHFALLKAVDSNDGLKSIPVEFKEGYNGRNLKKNDVVTNKK